MNGITANASEGVYCGTYYKTDSIGALGGSAYTAPSAKGLGFSTYAIRFEFVLALPGKSPRAAKARFDSIPALGADAAPVYKVLASGDGWQTFWEEPFETVLDTAEKKTYALECRTPVTNICFLGPNSTRLRVSNVSLKTA